MTLLYYPTMVGVRSCPLNHPFVAIHEKPGVWQIVHEPSELHVARALTLFHARVLIAEVHPHLHHGLLTSSLPSVVVGAFPVQVLRYLAQMQLHPEPVSFDAWNDSHSHWPPAVKHWILSAAVFVSTLFLPGCPPPDEACAPMSETAPCIEREQDRYQRIHQDPTWRMRDKL